MVRYRKWRTRCVAAAWLVMMLGTALNAVAEPSPALPPLAAGEQGQLFALQGSNTVGARLAPELARDYLMAKGVQRVSIRARGIANEYRVEGRYAGTLVFIDVAAHGTGTGMRGLASGVADIAMASRPITVAETQLFEHPEAMRTFEAEHVVAIDGLAVIVHPDNPVSSLTVDQIAGLFSGRFQNWSAVGGPERRVSLYARDDRSGTWDSFRSMVLGDDNELVGGTPRFESNDRLSDAVAADRGAIGFVGLASVRKTKALSVSHANVRPLSPSPLYVATEDYALARRLYFYTHPAQTSPLVAEFIHFAQGELGQRRVADVGFVAQTPVEFRPELPAGAPADYQALAAHSERLSINFRFDRGSSRLDNKALWDVQRLTQFMETPENRNRQLQLIGFGDAHQSEQRAQVLSRMRALRVKAALRDGGVEAASVVGFGGLLPVAEGEGAGRLKNQRVEVWLFDSEAASTVNGIKTERWQTDRPPRAVDVR